MPVKNIQKVKEFRNFDEHPFFHGDPYQFEILKLAIQCEDISIWNRWVTLNNITTIDLRGVSLMFTDLSNILLCNANLSNSDFSHSSLENADLCNAIMHNCTFYNTNILNANMHGADLYKARLQSVVYAGSELHNALIRNTEINDTNIYCMKSLMNA